jgi:hypothetical protein
MRVFFLVLTFFIGLKVHGADFLSFPAEKEAFYMKGLGTLYSPMKESKFLEKLVKVYLSQEFPSSQYKILEGVNYFIAGFSGELDLLVVDKTTDQIVLVVEVKSSFPVDDKASYADDQLYRFFSGVRLKERSRLAQEGLRASFKKKCDFLSREVSKGRFSLLAGEGFDEGDESFREEVFPGVYEEDFRASKHWPSLPKAIKELVLESLSDFKSIDDVMIFFKKTASGLVKYGLDLNSLRSFRKKAKDIPDCLPQDLVKIFPLVRKYSYSRLKVPIGWHVIDLTKEEAQQLQVAYVQKLKRESRRSW